ncbi:MAG TPA: histidine kinase [Arenibacter sp.]|nr:histidine kinase [Arenibacter sp.]
MITLNMNAGLLVLQSGPDVFASTAVYAGLLFCGALGLLSFFILLVYLKTRERIYLYYCLFIVFSLAGGIIDLGKHTGLDSFVWKEKGLAGASLELVTLMAFSAYCFFTIKLLDLKVKNKKLYNWIIVIAYGSASYGLIYYFIRPFVIDRILVFFIVSRSVIMLMSMVALFWVMLKIKSPVKNYFIIGSAWYFIGAMLAILKETTNQFLFASFYNLDATIYFQSGIFFETLCFALALTYRMYLHYEERQQNQIQVSTQAIYEKEMAQAEALALRIQINPHFLFNCLNLINYYIQSNQNKKATQYLITFSQFIRGTLDTHQKMVISLEEELKIIKNYLTLEKERFNQSFSYRLEIHPSVDLANSMIPPMLLQPLVEEAVWNGPLSNRPYNKELTIDIRQEGTILTITIKNKGMDKEDNGVRNPKKFHKVLSKQLLAERIALFNKNYKEKATCEIKEVHEGENYNSTVMTIRYMDQPRL